MFVKIDRSRADPDALDRLGLDRDLGDLGTASLSPAQVDALTDEDWVLFVRLSGRLRLLVEPQPSPPAGQAEVAGKDRKRRRRKDGGSR